MLFKSRFVVVISLLLILVVSGFSQVRTNVNELNRLSAQFNTRYEIQRGTLFQQYLNDKSEAWQKLLTADGIELIGVTPDGRPIIYGIDNRNAAISISLDHVWPGGDGIYDLTGSGTAFGELAVWDGGSVYQLHQEFAGRVIVADGINYDDHATHVGGTMVAAGINTNARGGSYEANLMSYNWNNDDSEMASAAASGLRVSNHSYSPLAGFAWSNSAWYWYGDPGVSETEDWSFGFYGSEAREWDQIAYNAPFYTICKSAGNDRGDGPAPGGTHYVWNGGWVQSTTVRQQDGGTDGYDCVGPRTTAKNLIAVGAVNDVNGGYSGPGSVTMSSFSSWGPCDDGRIKPDLVTNGVNLLSTLDTGIDDYGSMSGTSMSTPSFSGALNVIVQYYEDSHEGNTPRSATMKALAIHTADECGDNEGPDYMFGWGLFNAKKAADVIAADTAGQAGMYEFVLDEDETQSYFFDVSGDEPFIATIAWTDPAAPRPATALNNRTPNLINDLDLRVTHLDSETEYMPYTLDPDNPSDPAVPGDNVVDNVEKIFIDEPEAGQYRIDVSHKDNLTNGTQAYSLIVTGVDQLPDPRIPPTDLTATLDESTGEVLLTWNFNPDELDEFQHFRVKLFGEVLAEPTDTFYVHTLEEFGEFRFGVTAVWDEGESRAAGPAFVNWQMPIAPSYLEISSIDEEGNLQLTWEQFRESTILYDDDTFEGDLTFASAAPEGAGFAQRFTVPGAGKALRVGAHLRQGLVDFGRINISFMEAGADTTAPGDIFYVIEDYVAEEDGWNWIDLGSDRIPFDAGNDFWVAVQWIDRGQTILSNDRDNYMGRGAQSFDGVNWTPMIDAVAGNPLIRVDYGTDEPLSDLDELLSWNVLRDGETISTETTDKFFDDQLPSMGTYTYTVAANWHQGQAESQPLEITWSDDAVGDMAIPSEFAIGKAYPNPFNPEVTVSVELARNANIRAEVFDILGRKVTTLVNTAYTAGNHRISWNAQTSPSGVYFLQIQAGPVFSVQKVLLMK